jgi:hypothetical protein
MTKIFRREAPAENIYGFNLFGSLNNNTIFETIS